ncbi:RNA polymerase sigma factor [Anianabacter salinae]|uniref:RNA polymerase sigma factor n=1 Tax=Anianabacter salinae TaxID=2851023 RepID=UPI00225E1117|nr:RNA polymerase sigma factor [Anianabacter salinae]MBV0913686.1 RNA polymerase sigma factor [Anianabacter salinae]
MTRDPREELIDHLPALRAFAMSLTRSRSAADDLVQDTIEKAWRNLDKYEVGTNLRAWLFTILRNTFYSGRRKSKREVEDVDGVMAASLAEKPHHDGRLAMNDFRNALEKLPDEQREALILVGASGFTYEEAADMCNCAVGTIKSRANRGRKRLAELLHLGDDEDMLISDHNTAAVLSSGNNAA